MSAVLPVGILEIAGRLGVKRATVDQWLQRDLLPTPDWTVGGRPAWDWRVICRWAVETGRLLTVADLTTTLGLPASAQERVARFAGAFRKPAEYTKTGQIPPRWAGDGLDATFTHDEVETLVAEWHRTATVVGPVGDGALSPVLDDPHFDPQEVARRYRP